MSVCSPNLQLLSRSVSFVDGPRPVTNDILSSDQAIKLNNVKTSSKTAKISNFQS